MGSQVGREADAFAAYGRVWKLTGQKAVPVDPVIYRTLASGFDQRVFDLGKVAAQLSGGVATGAMPPESALLQMTKLKEEMDDAQATINIMKPTAGISAATVAARVFAADQMNQSLQMFQNYIESRQIEYRNNGLDLYRQAVAQLNAARASQ